MGSFMDEVAVSIGGRCRWGLWDRWHEDECRAVKRDVSAANRHRGAGWEARGAVGIAQIGGVQGGVNGGPGSGVGGKAGQRSGQVGIERGEQAVGGACPEGGMDVAQGGGGVVERLGGGGHGGFVSG